MSAEDNYHRIASTLTSNNIDQIISYYKQWQGQYVIPIKFRFIKIFAKDLDTGSSKWYLLHHLVNKRRITNEQLPGLLNEIIDNNIIPLRIFHSVTEWLAPNEVWSNSHHHPRIIRSGFLPLENDDNLEISLQTARQIKSIVKDLCHFVFSGNKSIHVWYPLEPDIKDPRTLAYADQREDFEAKFRTKLYEKIQDKISNELDKRISIDTRRVVPIIGTINAMTGHKVIIISDDKLEGITPSSILEQSRIKNWCE